MNIFNMNNNNIYVEGEGVPVIKFRCFDDIPFVNHCFTTKEGGVSKGIYSSMNLSFTRGDNTGDVINNYRRLYAEHNFTLDNIVMSDQVHKTDVCCG